MKRDSSTRSDLVLEDAEKKVCSRKQSSTRSDLVPIGNVNIFMQVHLRWYEVGPRTNGGGSLGITKSRITKFLRPPPYRSCTPFGFRGLNLKRSFGAAPMNGFPFRTSPAVLRQVQDIAPTVLSYTKSKAVCLLCKTKPPLARGFCFYPTIFDLRRI